MGATGVSGGRVGAMAIRLADTARRLGADQAGCDLLSRAFEIAMAPRLARLDEHHPDFLHPARTALILMDDVRIGDPVTLAAGALTESRDPALRPMADAAAALGPDVAALAAEVADLADHRGGTGASGASGVGLLERLVLASGPARLIAVAERLDHARHLHLRDRAEWAPYHALTCSVFAPAASRAHPVLERRFAAWCGTFSRRFIPRA